MSDLVEFLLARIAEDEAVARAVYSHGSWTSSNTYGMFVSIEAHSWTVVSGEWERADANHVARHDPARVLAECEAKRRIVELDECMACQVEAQPCGHRNDTLRLLALPYADHPDYRGGWRP